MHTYDDDDDDDTDGIYGDKIKGVDEDETRGQASEPKKAERSEGSSRMSHAVRGGNI